MINGLHALRKAGKPDGQVWQVRILADEHDDTVDWVLVAHQPVYSSPTRRAAPASGTRGFSRSDTLVDLRETDP